MSTVRREQLRPRHELTKLQANLLGIVRRAGRAGCYPEEAVIIATGPGVGPSHGWQALATLMERDYVRKRADGTIIARPANRPRKSQAGT